MPTLPRTSRFRSLPAALALALLLGGCGLLGRSGPPIDRSQDARIGEEVRARLVREPTLDADLIRVEVKGGMVLLYGSVRGMGAWQCALRNVELVPGVTSVVDYLVLERGPRDVPCLAPAAGATDP
jgi:hypothetical protein